MSSSVDRLVQLALNSLRTTLSATIGQWLAAHPTVYWLVMHPRIGLAVLLLLVFLGWGLVGVLSRLAQQVWIVVLNTPVRVMWWLLLRIGAFLRSQWLMGIANRQLDATQPHRRLEGILQRLDQLRQEQDALMEEVRSLLSDASPSGQISADPLRPNSAQSRLTD